LHGDCIRVRRTWLKTYDMYMKVEHDSQYQISDEEKAFRARSRSRSYVWASFERDPFRGGGVGRRHGGYVYSYLCDCLSGCKRV
jgi:hypothetical protein